jgi:hypothetical protein
MWQRTEMLHSLRRARFLAAGWRRLAENSRTDGTAWMHAWAEAANTRDAALANAEAVLATADAMRADLARAAAVVEAARGMTANGDFPDLLDTNNEAAWALQAALAKYEEG